MITRARHSDWPLDVQITDLGSAGLPFVSVVRMQLFTLTDQLVIRKSGALAHHDQQADATSLQRLLGCAAQRPPLGESPGYSAGSGEYPGSGAGRPSR
jgi:hypothetical protein